MFPNTQLNPSAYMGPSPLILPLFPRSRGRLTSPQLLSGIAGSDEVSPEPLLLHTQPSHLPQPPLRTPAPRTVSVGVPQSRARRAGRQQRFLQRAGRDVPGVQRDAPHRLFFLLPILLLLSAGLGAAQRGSACGERRWQSSESRQPRDEPHRRRGAPFPGAPRTARSSAARTAAPRSMAQPRKRRGGAEWRRCLRGCSPCTNRREWRGTACGMRWRRGCCAVSGAPGPPP